MESVSIIPVTIQWRDLDNADFNKYADPTEPTSNRNMGNRLSIFKSQAEFLAPINTGESRGMIRVGPRVRNNRKPLKHKSLVDEGAPNTVNLPQSRSAIYLRGKRFSGFPGLGGGI